MSAYEDPSAILADDMPTYFSRTPVENTKLVVETVDHGKKVFFRLVDPSKRDFHLTVQTPFAVHEFPAIWPYGNRTEDYPNKMYTSATDLGARYETLMAFRPHDAHVANPATGLDRHCEAFAEWLQQLLEHFKREAWANADMRKLIVGFHLADFHDGLERELKAIQLATLKKDTLSSAQQRLRRWHQLKEQAQRSEAEDAEFRALEDEVVPNERTTEALFMASGQSLVKRRRDKETKEKMPGTDHLALKGKVWTKMSAKYRKFRDSQKPVFARQLEADRWAEQSKEAPFGYWYNDIDLVWASTRRSVPWAKRRETFTHGSVASARVQVVLGFHKDTHEPRLYLEPLKLLLLRRGQGRDDGDAFAASVPRFQHAEQPPAEEEEAAAPPAATPKRPAPDREAAPSAKRPAHSEAGSDYEPNDDEWALAQAD